MPAHRFHLVIAGLLFAGLVSCTTQPQQSSVDNLELTRGEGRLGVGVLRLGDSASSIDAKATAQYNESPRCENRRVAIADTRKAFGLRICEYKPQAAVLHDATVVRIVTYSLDDYLVRLDIDTQADESNYIDALESVNQAWSAGQKRTLSASNRDETVWRSDRDEMGISYHAAQSQTQYRIIDTQLPQALAWLAQ